MRLDDADLIKAVRVLSEEWSDKYQIQRERESEKAERLLNDPKAGLEFLLENGFARAGGQQAGYGRISIQDLKEAISECGSYHKMIKNFSTLSTLYVTYLAPISQNLLPQSRLRTQPPKSSICFNK